MHIIWPKYVRNDFIKIRTLKNASQWYHYCLQENIAVYAVFCKIQLGKGVIVILKKVGLYLQNDSYLISNSPYTNKLASKL